LFKIVVSGKRFFMKYPELDYFEKRAKEASAFVVPCKSDDNDEFKEVVKDADAIVVIGRKIDKIIIMSLEKCKIILALQVGYDCVDIESATKKGIVVCNVPTYCTDEVATHAMTLLLSVSRKINLLIDETKNARWDYNISRPIFSFKYKTLGIIGLGRIGRSVVPKARGFGMNIIAYDPYLDNDIFKLLNVDRKYDISDLLKESDYITIHTPLTAETYHLIDDKEFQLMKDNVVIINTARGNIINEKALYKNLKSKRILGAGIDVFGDEPPGINNPLLNCKNAIVTPHTAWYSEESLINLTVLGMDDVINVLKGKHPGNIVNPEIFGLKKDL